MAAGYTRQSAASIVSGLTITAAAHNNEYNAIQAAFDASTGHNHDGTAGGGAPIGASGLSGTPGTGLVSNTGSGFAGRTLTAPAAGITVTNGTGAAGNPTLALANDLSALEGLATTGLAARTASDTWTTRTLTGPAAGISVTNGDGVSGNPTLALANDLSALEGLTTAGVAVRTASDTWTTRTVTGTANEITVTNGDGVSGNPTLSLPAALTFTGKTVTGGTISGATLSGTTSNSGTLSGGTIAGATLSGTTTLPGSSVISSAGKIGVKMTPVNDLDVTGTFGVTGAATLGSTLNVTGIATFSTDISSSGNISSTAHITADGNMTATKFTGKGDGITNISFSANKNGTDQTGVTASTDVKVTFTNEEWDVGGYYDAANSKFLPLIAGKYLITAVIRFANLNIVDGAGYSASIYKNGSAYHDGNVALPSGTSGPGVSVTTIVDMNGTTDYVEVYAFGGGGGAGTKTINGATRQTYFQAVRVG